MRHCNFNKLLDIKENRTTAYYKTAPDKCFIKWAKHILGVHSKSTNIAVSAELGYFPILFDSYCQMAAYWNRLCRDDINPILKDSYNCNLQMLNKGEKCWLNDIKQLLCKVGLEKVWNRETRYSNKGLKHLLLSKLKEIFTQQWNLDIYNDNKPGNSSNKLRTFRKFKSDISLEPYLLLLRENSRKTLTRLRISAHNLGVETGRHHRPSPIPLNERLCTLCDEGSLDDELHLIMTCSKFKNERQSFLEQLSNIFPPLTNHDEETIFTFIMQCQDNDLAKCLERYLNQIQEIRGSL